MARYTEEFLAALKHAYENTDEPMSAVALRFGIGVTTLGNHARKLNWKKRSERMRGCPPALDLLAQARALAAGEVPHSDSPSPLTPTLSPHSPPKTGVNALLLGRGSANALPVPPSEEERAAAIGRLEALVLKEIAAEESVRAELKARPRARGETEKNARALSILAQTWDALQHMRAGKPVPTGTPADDDDMPRDLDAFRDELARRIDAFVAARPDEADAACAERADADAAE